MAFQYNAVCSYCEQKLPTVRLKQVNGVLLAYVDIDTHQCDFLERVKSKFRRFKIWQKKKELETTQKS